MVIGLDFSVLVSYNIVYTKGDNYETLGNGNQRVFFRTFGSDDDSAELRHYRTLEQEVIMGRETQFWVNVIGFAVIITIGLW